MFHRCLYWAVISVMILAGFVPPSVSTKMTGGEHTRELTPHEPILIENSTHLQEFVSNLGLPGNGTSGNPYIIENLDIDGQRKTPSIGINHTSEHILIRNCRLYNGGDPYYSNFNERSIKANRVGNLSIMDCVVDSSYLYYSENLVMSDVSWQTGNGTGIEMIGCFQARMEGVKLANKSLSLVNCGDIRIEDCSVSGMNGIMYIYSNYNTAGDIHIINCSFEDTRGGARDEGLYLGNTYDTHLYSCEFFSSCPRIGYYSDVRFLESIDIASNNTVDGKPLIIHNGDDLQGVDIPADGGYYMFINSSNILLDEVIMDGVVAGVSMLGCSDIHVVDCSISNASLYGLDFARCDGIVIENTRLADSATGIFAQFPLDTSIIDSEFERCSNGTRLQYRSDGGSISNISGTRFFQCDTGLNVYYVNNVMVTNSSFVECQNGIGTYQCSDGLIYNNTFSGCVGPAMDLRRGFDNLVYWNRFIDNNVDRSSQVEDNSDRTLWYDPDINEGNHWSDHRDPDEDHDGIVDDPYDVVGGEVFDERPLVSAPGTAIVEPRNLTVNVGNREAVLKWKMPFSGPMPVVTGFRIIRDQGRIANTTEITVGPGMGSFRDGDVEFGKQYNYSVSSFNTREISKPTGPVSVFIFDRPGVPRNFTYECHRDHLNLSWEPPVYDGGTPVVSYRIYRSTSPIVWAFIGESDETYYRDAGVEIGQTYYYYVRSVNVIGEGELSEPFRALAITKPDSPLLAVDSTTSFSIKVRWSEPEYDGGYPITGFRIYRGEDEERLDSIAIVGFQNRSHEDTGLEKGSHYFYSVTALNNVGESTMSNVINVTVGEIRPDLPRPFDLVTIPGNGYVLLEFKRPEVPPDLSFIQHRVYRRSGGSNFTIIGTTASDRYRDNTVVNGIMYEYRISSEYVSGESGFTDTVNATPLSIIDPLGSPIAFTAIPGSGNVTLTWREPDDERNGTITAFNIYRKEDGGTLSLLASVDGNDRYFIDRSARGGLTYEYYITAVYIIGESDMVGPVSVTPQSVKRRPSAPASIDVERGDDRVIIRWTPPGDTGSSPISSYRIYRRVQGETPVMIKEVDGDILEYTDTDITHGDSYRYNVAAVNTAGEGEKSIDAMITFPMEDELISSPEEENVMFYMLILIGVLVLIILLGTLLLFRRRGPPSLEE